MSESRCSASLAQINAELDTVNAKLEVLRARDNDLTTLINQMVDMRVSVRDEVSTLKEKKTDLEASRNPLNRMPNELLLQIFESYAMSNMAEESLFYPPPLIPSQVCQHWRQLCLGSPSLWRRISSSPTMSSFRLTELFLQRSGQQRLDITHLSPNATDAERSNRLLAMNEFRFLLLENFSRLRSLTWSGAEIPHILPLLPIVNKYSELRRIRKLCISLTGMRYPGQYNEAFDRHIEWRHQRNWASTLEDIRLEHVPPFALSPCLYTNLRRLELCFTFPPPSNSQHRAAVDPAYIVEIRDFLELLFTARSLEALILTHLRLGFLGMAGAPVSSAGRGRFPVHLPRLKHIEWNGHLSYMDLHRLISRISCPVLEDLEVGIDKPDDGSRNANNILRFDSLKALYVGTSCDPPFDSSSRAFSFAALEHLEITNTRLRPGSLSLAPEHLILPRLEHIFRDPRFPHLTHLTLSRFRISSEEGADGRLILGYMPSLTFLSLDNCAGVGILLDCLQDLVVVTFTERGQRNTSSDAGPSPRVKVCPRLEALAMWGCDDLDMDDLRAVVSVRNGLGPVRRPSSQGDQKTHQDKTVSSTRDGDGRESRQATRRTPQQNSVEGGSNVGEGQTRRIIKPLRKARPGTSAELVHDQGRTSPRSPSLSHMDQHLTAAAHRVDAPSIPVNIVHIRIEGCKLITEEHAASLRDLGVPDVVWKSSTGAKFTDV